MDEKLQPTARSLIADDFIAWLWTQCHLSDALMLACPSSPYRSEDEEERAPIMVPTLGFLEWMHRRVKTIGSAPN